MKECYYIFFAIITKTTYELYFMLLNKPEIVVDFFAIYFFAFFYILFN